MALRFAPTRPHGEQEAGFSSMSMHWQDVCKVAASVHRGAAQAECCCLENCALCVALRHPSPGCAAVSLLSATKVAAWLMSSRCACLFSDQLLEQMLLELSLGWRSLAQRSCASDAAPCASRAQNLTPAADRGLSVPTLPQTVLQLASRSGTLNSFRSTSQDCLQHLHGAVSCQAGYGGTETISIGLPGL